MKVEIYPLDKVVIDGTPIFLGAKQEIVEGAIGKGDFIGNRHYYYDNEMAIDYDADKKVKFIEFLGGIDGFLHPQIYGVSAFDAPAEELAGILKGKNNGDAVDLENGHSLLFSKISVGVYRETTPEDVAEMIEDMRDDGVSVEGNEDIEIEMRKANHWATIGAGVAGYYADV